VSHVSLKRTFALLALSASLAGCANARSVPVQGPPNNESQATAADLSTDEGVRAELQKMVDAKNAERGGGDERLEARLKAAGRLKAANVCIERLKEPAKVVVVGFFRYDYGCHFEGVFVDTRYFEASDNEIHRAALRALGWGTTDEAGREGLARLWVEKGLHAFHTVPYADEAGLLRNSRFRPPRTVTAGDGGVKVDLWIQLPPGRKREKRFQHHEYRFNPDGSFSGSTTLASVVT